jgi:hypothetical protein
MTKLIGRDAKGMLHATGQVVKHMFRASRERTQFANRPVHSRMARASDEYPHPRMARANREYELAVCAQIIFLTD